MTDFAKKMHNRPATEAIWRMAPHGQDPWPERCAAGLVHLDDRRWASGRDADLPCEIPASQAELAML